MANTFAASPYSNPSMKRPTGASTPAPSSKKTGSTMSRPTSGVPKAANKSLSGIELTTYHTLQAHDSLKGTRCAPAYVEKLNAAQLQYDDEIRIASLKSSKLYGGHLRHLGSPRSIAEKAAKTALTLAKAAAIKFAGDCMRGIVPAGVAGSEVPQTLPSVDQDEIDAEAEAEATKKRNTMILYAVLGLGAAGTAFFFLRRRG